MITANQRDPLGIAHLQGKEKQERLDGMEASIDKVSHENVVCLRTVTADPEQLHQVIELAMDVAAYLHVGKIQSVNNRLFIMYLQ